MAPVYDGNKDKNTNKGDGKGKDSSFNTSLEGSTSYRNSSNRKKGFPIPKGPTKTKYSDENKTNIDILDTLKLDSGAQSKTISTTFGKVDDYVEFHVYNNNNTLIYSDNDFQDYSLPQTKKYISSDSIVVEPFIKPLVVSSSHSGEFLNTVLTVYILGEFDSLYNISTATTSFGNNSLSKTKSFIFKNLKLLTIPRLNPFLGK